MDESSQSMNIKGEISGAGGANDCEVIKRKKTRIPKIRQTLAIMLASLQGTRVVLELKNDVEVYGLIDEVDSTMAVTLVSVKEIFPSGNVKESDVLHINGKAIRYVHIPPEIKPVSHVNNYIKTIDRITRSSRPNVVKDVPNKKAKIEITQTIDDDD